MFGSDILDTAVGLIFIFLLLSLIGTAVNEIVERFVRMRSKQLFRGIQELLDKDERSTGDENDCTYTKMLYEHPLVYALFLGDYRSALPERWKRSQLPSYIPSRTFALAITDMLFGKLTQPAEGQPVPPRSLESLRSSLATLPPEHYLRRALTPLVDNAGKDLDKAMKNIEDWYDSAMDRISGRYKRYAQKVIIVFGLITAIALNADAFEISRTLYINKVKRDTVVASAGQYLRTKNTAGADIEETSPEVRASLKELDQLGLPMGWDTRTFPNARPNSIGDILLRLGGWVVTALAVSLGAPFWFDLLNKIMVVRSTVKPKEKSPDEPAVDRDTTSQKTQTP